MRESALELATKAMRLNPAFPPWYTAPACLALFVLGRDTELIELGSRVPISMFVDVPAFLAASIALAGDLDRARWYLARFLAAVRERITFGRAPEPGEPLRWLLHVNPFRREQDIESAGAWSADRGPRRRPRRRPARSRRRGRSPSETGAARFRQDGDVWTLAFHGLSVQLTHQKGFSDLARLLHRPGVEMHCLELADRPAETTGIAPVLDERARREIQARARELQAGDRRSRRLARSRTGRTGAGRARSASSSSCPARSAWAAAPGRLAASPNARGRPSRGVSATASRRSARPTPVSDATSRTRCARGRSASTSRKRPSSGPHNQPAPSDPGSSLARPLCPLRSSQARLESTRLHLLSWTKSPIRQSADAPFHCEGRPYAHWVHPAEVPMSCNAVPTTEEALTAATPAVHDSSARALRDLPREGARAL